MVDNRIRGGICHSINRYTKAYNKYMKDYDQNKEQSNLIHWKVYVNNLCGQTISQKLPADGFEWVENNS